MTHPNPKTKFTYHDYATAPEDKRFELLDGELLMVPAPTTYHQRLSRRLFVRLEEFVTSRGLGEVFYAPCDVVLSDQDVVQPDLLFVSNERSHIITSDNIQGGPDLVVEILSPSTTDRDLGYKRTLYSRHGVGEYWVVDPETRTVEVLSASRGEFTTIAKYAADEELGSATFEGLLIRLAEVF